MNQSIRSELCLSAAAAGRARGGILGLTLASLVTFAPMTGAGEALEGQSAFAQLKSLAGEWQGTLGKADGPATTVLYRVTANGNTVMETMFPGTDHEMISMYHLDRGELVLTHYCAAGNQPRMRLDAASSSTNRLVFKFDGGTNLDPKKDMHIHSGTIRRPEANRLEADWLAYSEGQPAGTNRFLLRRKAP